MNTSPTLPAQGLSTSVSVNKRNAALANAAEVSGRFLLALLFLLSGVGKLGAYTATAAYMSATGVPGAWLPAVLTALTFHNNLADQTQMIMFFKNLSIAGGFLLLAANGAGPLSLDRRAAKQGSR